MQEVESSSERDTDEDLCEEEATVKGTDPPNGQSGGVACHERDEFDTNHEDDDSDKENVETLQYRHLSFEEDDFSLGRFALLSHENESIFPWIGKVRK